MPVVTEPLSAARSEAPKITVAPLVEPVNKPVAEVGGERARPAFPSRPEAAKPAAQDSASSLDTQLIDARAQLIARLGAEIRPERRSLLSRGELAKLVDAAVQAYFVRNSVNADPLARRDLVTAILQELLSPGTADPEALGNRRSPHRALVESAKAQIQPLVLEHMDVAAAAEMPRPAFEAQLTGWVKELLAETKIQLNFAEQRELVESLIADMLGLGPLEPLMGDETITDIMVNGPAPSLHRAQGQARARRRTFPRRSARDERCDQDRVADRTPHRRSEAARRCPSRRRQPRQRSSSRHWRSTAPRSQSANSRRRPSLSTSWRKPEASRRQWRQC